eukprot:3603477-Prymnesium_polylepis.1
MKEGELLRLVRVLGLSAEFDDVGEQPEVLGNLGHVQVRAPLGKLLQQFFADRLLSRGLWLAPEEVKMATRSTALLNADDGRLALQLAENRLESPDTTTDDQQYHRGADSAAGFLGPRAQRMLECGS